MCGGEKGEKKKKDKKKEKKKRQKKKTNNGLLFETPLCFFRFVLPSPVCPHPCPPCLAGAATPVPGGCVPTGVEGAWLGWWVPTGLPQPPSLPLAPLARCTLLFHGALVLLGQGYLVLHSGTPKPHSSPSARPCQHLHCGSSCWGRALLPALVQTPWLWVQTPWLWVQTVRLWVLNPIALGAEPQGFFLEQEGASSPEMASNLQQGPCWRRRRHLLPPSARPWLSPRYPGCWVCSAPSAFRWSWGAAQHLDHPPPMSQQGALHESPISAPHSLAPRYRWQITNPG